ncbi:hypothetical protein AK812_SmicGene8668 [Symbiodinium microadriaticum]|uniref:Uncharacterized protein n=1 Tax=Symbiodinium microadriaticum TaxID=2951 RepID=A0A1Q9EKD3_SYMMI|nr:hypothetical protein AK812_SmicGene8668 [Symbiodinium microadriaticum]
MMRAPLLLLELLLLPSRTVEYRPPPAVPVDQKALPDPLVKAWKPRLFSEEREVFHLDPAADMCERLNNMEAEVKELRTKFARVELLYTDQNFTEREQVLFWVQNKKPSDGAMMLTNANGDETGWWVHAPQLGRLLSLDPEQVREELLS